MKKKIIGITIWLLICLFFLNNYFLIEYSLSIWDYFTHNNQFNDEEIAYLNQVGYLTYAADQYAPPLNFVNPSTEQFEGLVIDYIKVLSNELGVNIRTKPMIFHESLNALEVGDIDFSDVYPSEERSKRFDFSEPIYYQRGAILIRKNDLNISLVDHIEGRRLAAVEGEYVIEYIHNNYDNVTIAKTNVLTEAIELLEAGEVDAVVGDESVLRHFLMKKSLYSEYSLLNDYFYESHLAFAVTKGNSILLNILNKGIAQLNGNHTMERIHEKWFGNAPLVMKNKQQDKHQLMIQFLLVVTVLIFVSFYYWNLKLKREVDRKTKALVQSNKMAALGKLSAGIAHEIRTPLAIIRNDTYLLKRSKDKEDYLLHVENIERATARANKIINNLLNFSALSDTTIKTIDIEAFVSDIYKMSKKQIKHNNINFEFVMEEDVRITTYVESLKHILLNLFANAQDAMPNGGTLKVIVGAAGDLYRIEVCDTGHGIEPKHLSSVFDPFFTTKSSGKGTGLGLYIAYNEAEKINGNLRVKNTTREGTTFLLEFKRMENQHG